MEPPQKSLKGWLILENYWLILAAAGFEPMLLGVSGVAGSARKTSGKSSVLCQLSHGDHSFMHEVKNMHNLGGANSIGDIQDVCYLCDKSGEVNSFWKWIRILKFTRIFPKFLFKYCSMGIQSVLDSRTASESLDRIISKATSATVNNSFEAKPVLCEKWNWKNNHGGTNAKKFDWTHLDTAQWVYNLF